MSDTRRRLGIALVAGGLLFLGTAGAAYARGAMARERIRTEWEVTHARAAREGLDRMLGARPAFAPRAGEPVARLLIPALGLDEIVVEGIDDRQLNVGPGHVPQSVAPGATGNSVISAHRDRHFARLDEIAIGDTITTETIDGSTTWVVVARRVVSRHARPLRDAGRAELTLTTCWPVRYLGPAPDRLIVTALPASAAPPSRQAADSRTGSRARS